LEKKSIAVIGAGPKAAALAAKAKALRDCKGADINVLVFERTELAAHWTGGVGGYTDGEGTNVTPPEKDVGFPYNSPYGIDVDSFLMRNFSWAAHLISLGAYADWIDHGSPRPRHAAWGRYVQWVLRRADAQILFKTVLSIQRIEDKPGKILVLARDRTKETPYEVDGIVFTGPGPSRKLGDNTGSSDDIDDARNYWLKIPEYAALGPGKIAVVGGGETAANVAISLLEINRELKIEIINRHGTMFSRGESFFENQLFSSNRGWAERNLQNRSEIIARADRGLVSARALARLGDTSKRVAFRAARVKSFRKDLDKNEIQVLFDGESEPIQYDRVINATGFDSLAVLNLMDKNLYPKAGETLTDDEQKGLSIDSKLRLRTEEPHVNIHVPMISATSQGPGIVGLSSLGMVSDMVLSAYVDPPNA
jgi:mycobactin lysine-N-oxygenase